MKAIFIGTLADGFSINAVIEDAAAEEVVIAHLANGTIAEAMDVRNPATMDKGTVKDAFGAAFIVYGKGLRNGFEVYGPFADDNVAEEFAEKNRREDDEWELFESTQALTPTANEQYTEILQHRIEWFLRGDNVPQKLDDCSVEHIEGSIKEGYNQGELCVLGDDGDTEYRGWWSIKSN